MADNIDATPGTGATLKTFDDGTAEWAAGITAYVTGGSAGAWTIQHVTSSVGLPIADAGGSLTVDAPVGTPVFVRLSDGSAAITTLPVSLASVPSHAVTNAGTFAVQAAQSGTWTVDLGATDNAVLDAIAASVAGTLTVGTHAVTQSGTWNITNISGTVSLPTGASTLAEQQSQTTHLATIAGDTTDIETAVELIDDAIVADDAAFTPATTKVMMAGFEYDDTSPDTVNEGDAGAARMSTRREIYTQIRDAAGNERGLNIDASGYATVNVNGTVPVTVTSTTITGTVAVTQSGTWDEVGINDSGNSITVDNNGTFAVQAVCTNAGTFAVQVDGAALTALQLIDDTVATLGTTTYTEAATKGLIVGAIRRDADTTLVDTTNEVGPLQMNAAGQLKVEVFSGEALPVTLTSTTVTGTVAVTQSGTWDEVGINDSGNSITVDNAGTFAVQAACTNAGTFAVQVDGNALTALQLIDDVIYVDDADWSDGSSKHALVGGLYQSSPQTITDGDVGPFQVTANGYLIVSVTGTATVSGTVTANAGTNLNTSALALETGGNLAACATSLGTLDNAISGSEMQVDIVGALPAGTNGIGKLTANSGVDIGDVDVTSIIPGTGATNLGKAEDAAHNSGDVGVMMLAVRQDAHADLAADGDYMPPTIDADGGLRVSVVAGGGTGGTAVADDADFTAGTTAGTPVMGVYESSPTSVTDGDLGTVGITVTRSLKVQPAGNVAHDAADSGNPVKVGARAAGTLSDDTMVANADRTDLVSDLDGALLVRTARPLGDVISERVSNTDGASTAFTNFGATASTRNVVTGYAIWNASSTAGYVDFRDGTAGSILWTAPIPATGGSNFAIPDGIFRTTANTALAFDVSGALTTVYISVTGFKSKVT